MKKGSNIKLTDTAVRALACPPGKRDFVVFDALIPGFGVRVTAGGVKTFFLQFQLGGRGGRKERFLIARHLETRIVDGEPQVATAAWARSEAERARGMVRSGISPSSPAGRQIPRRRQYIPRLPEKPKTTCQSSRLGFYVWHDPSRLPGQ